MINLGENLSSRVCGQNPFDGRCGEALWNRLSSDISRRVGIVPSKADVARYPLVPNLSGQLSGMRSICSSIRDRLRDEWSDRG